MVFYNLGSTEWKKKKMIGNILQLPLKYMDG